MRRGLGEVVCGVFGVMGKGKGKGASTDGNEGEVEDCPYDVEFPAEGFDAWGRDFDDCVGGSV